MRFAHGPIDGYAIVDLEPVADHRGFFARSWCEEEFADEGLAASWRQCNVQFSPRPGTLRGFHYQLPPYSEVKLVRCTRGSIFDVAIDMRPQSPTYLHWAGVELTAENRTAAWIPSGCAHAYLTLEHDTEAFYLTSYQYVPESVRGIRYDDPAFPIDWPIDVSEVAPNHDDWPFFSRDNDYFWPMSEEGFK